MDEGLFLFYISGASDDAPIITLRRILSLLLSQKQKGVHHARYLPEGTILRVDRDTHYHNSLYFRKEPSNTGETWAKLDRDGETHHYINNEQPRVSSQWSGFEHASELMIIYVPES